MDTQNQPFVSFKIQLYDVWIQIPELMKQHDIFAVWFPNNMI